MTAANDAAMAITITVRAEPSSMLICMIIKHEQQKV
jgi:hypothetical protein